MMSSEESNIEIIGFVCVGRGGGGVVEEGGGRVKGTGVGGAERCGRKKKGANICFVSKS